jgi:hypothetical protein
VVGRTTSAGDEISWLQIVDTLADLNDFASRYVSFSLKDGHGMAPLLDTINSQCNAFLPKAGTHPLDPAQAAAESTWLRSGRSGQFCA